jgi:glyoxylase-like metal-dependent hydrolase (beta-lactamase superfamily II)
MTRKIVYHFEGVDYFRFSVYRMKMNVQTVYTFFVDGVLIDTAQRHNRINIYQQLKHKKIDVILLTHHHEDHSGNIAYLMKKMNVPAYGHQLAHEILKKGYTISPLANILSGSVDKANINVIQDNEIIETSHHQFRAIYTPGHSDDHFCYYEPNKGWLFSGDLYVADKIKYFAKFESFLTQIDSLKKLLQLDFDVLFCAHNPKVENGKLRLQTKLQYFEDFAGIVIKYRNEGLSTKEIFSKMNLKENYINKYLTFGGFCAENMVYSIVRDIKNNQHKSK